MIKKAAAILVACIMAMVGVCCMGVSDADSTGVTVLEDMHFNEEVQKIRTFTVNEGEYYGYGYTLTVSVVELVSGSETYSQVFQKIVDSSGQVKSYSNNNVKIKDGDVTVNSVDNLSSTPDGSNRGSYNIIVKRPNGDYKLGIRVEMNASIGTASVVLTPIHMSMEVSRGQVDTTNITFESLTYTVGTYNHFSVKETTQVLSAISNYHWYATDLPEGLSMSESGIISGIPEQTGTYTTKLFIFGHDNGDEFNSEITIIVKAASNDPNNFDFYLTGTVAQGEDEDKNLYDYVAIEGSNVELNITSDSAWSVLTVKTIVTTNDGDELETNQFTPGNSAKLTLNTSGSGCQKVLITYTINEGNTTETEIVYFHLYVIPAFDVVNAQIMISSH